METPTTVVMAAREISAKRGRRAELAFQDWRTKPPDGTTATPMKPQSVVRRLPHGGIVAFQRKGLTTASVSMAWRLPGGHRLASWTAEMLSVRLQQCLRAVAKEGRGVPVKAEVERTRNLVQATLTSLPSATDTLYETARRCAQRGSAVAAEGRDVAEAWEVRRQRQADAPRAVANALDAVLWARGEDVWPRGKSLARMRVSEARALIAAAERWIAVAGPGDLTEAISGAAARFAPTMDAPAVPETSLQRGASVSGHLLLLDVPHAEQFEVAAGYVVEVADSAALARLVLLDATLGSGYASLLNRALAVDDDLAYSAHTLMTTLNEERALFSAHVSLAPKQLAPGLAALMKVMSAGQAIDERELARAQHVARFPLLWSMQTSAGMASTALSAQDVWLGFEPYSWLENLDGVSPAEVNEALGELKIEDAVIVVRGPARQAREALHEWATVHGLPVHELVP